MTAVFAQGAEKRQWVKSSSSDVSHWTCLWWPLALLGAHQGHTCHILWQTNVNRKSLIALWLSQAACFSGYTWDNGCVFKLAWSYFLLWMIELNKATLSRVLQRAAAWNLNSLRPMAPGQATSIPCWLRGIGSLEPGEPGSPHNLTSFGLWSLPLITCMHFLTARSGLWKSQTL